MPIELTESNFEEFINTDVSVVDFYAMWCIPCVRLLTILPRLEEEAQITLGKVDIDQNKDLKDRLGVTSVPTFIFFKNGQEAYRVKGVIRLQELKEKIQDLRDQ